MQGDLPVRVVLPLYVGLSTRRHLYESALLLVVTMALYYISTVNRQIVRCAPYRVLNDKHVVRFLVTQWM